MSEVSQLFKYEDMLSILSRNRNMPISLAWSMTTKVQQWIFDKLAIFQSVPLLYSIFTIRDLH